MCLVVGEEVGSDWRLRQRSWGAPGQSRGCFHRDGWLGSCGCGGGPSHAYGGGLLGVSAFFCCEMCSER
jgi:hypothetical protein